MSARQHGSGSIVLDKRSNVWNFFFWENGKRRSRKIGTKAQYPTKKAASRALDTMQPRDAVTKTKGPLVSTLVEGYRREKMPQRLDTNRGYESWIQVHILPK